MTATAPVEPVPGPLAGRSAIVTGSSRGIGASIATHLAHEGAQVLVTWSAPATQDRGREIVTQIRASGGRAEGFEGDLRDDGVPQRLIERAVEAFGGVDILVNNAGYADYRMLGEFSETDVRATLELNVVAPFLLSQAAAAVMPEGGRIINIGSTVARRMARQTGSLYAASKSALIGLTKGMARDLGPRGITVNLLSPGPTRTEMLGDDPEKLRLMTSLMAFDRIGEPTEIAAAVAFLAGPGSSIITGAHIAADGGFTI